MKTLFTLLALSLVTTASLAQSGDYEELMQKSRRARTTSTIMVASGPVIAAGGIGTLIYGLLANDFDESSPIYDNSGNFLGYNKKSYTTEIVVGAAGAAAGIALALTSIHFSNKARDLKREARPTKLKTSSENISIPGLQSGFASNRTRQFKVSLVIPLGR